MQSWDVVVVGLGAAGAATLHELATRGQRAIGIDQFVPPHSQGSSHGRSRIIREAYFEDPRYVPLVQRAWSLWEQLERASGRQLLQRTGGLTIGTSSSALLTGALRSAREHSLPHERWSHAQLVERAPAFLTALNSEAVFETRAGILDPERAISTLLARAQTLGARIATTTAMQSFTTVADGVIVQTSSGALRTKRLVLALGPWASTHLPELALPLTVQRNVLFWFAPRATPELFSPSRFPVFLFERAASEVWYGFPDTGDGIKVALHGVGDTTTPQAVNRDVASHEIERAREFLHTHLPAANGALRSSVTCLYTNTPDGHFIIDRHPMHPRVVVASPCSGHGFKFAPALGELIADLAGEDDNAVGWPLFSARRFLRPAPLHTPPSAL